MHFGRHSVSFCRAFNRIRSLGRRLRFFSISNIIILLNCVVNNSVSSGTNSSVNSSVSVISNNVNGAAENSLRTISSNEFD